MLIVLCNRSLAYYPHGGGHWSWFLQYPLGLRALGHRVFWIELMKASGDRGRDAELAREFFSRIAFWGLERDCALLVFQDLDVQDLRSAETWGHNAQSIADVARSADLLWNLGCALRQPMLSRFRRRVLIDIDPGHLQVAATQWELGINDHEVHLSVGANLADPDCEVPRLGRTWHPFLPFVYLPQWRPGPDPGRDAPFSSITQWTWEELSLNGRTLSASKRAAYLRYVDLPARCARPFELAVNIGVGDPADDRGALAAGGWRVVDPHRIAGTPQHYQEYIRGSRAEIQCPKPIFRELNTGWFSDRSVSYLALGRPVLAEDTGFRRHIPVGRGILTFRDGEEARAAVAEIDGNYALHSRGARELARDLFNSERQLGAMLAACA